MLLEVAQLEDGLTPVEVRILPPPLVYPRLNLPLFTQLPLRVVFSETS